MNLVKWTPFGDIDKFFDDDFFPVVPMMQRKSLPQINVYQTKNDVVVEASIAGINPKDVYVTLENDVLTIKGETKEEKETKDKEYFCKEIKEGKFLRSVNLPAHVDSGKAKAESVDGMLKIIIPKTEKKAVKQIPIKVSNKKK